MRIYPYARYLNISDVVLPPHWTGAKKPHNVDTLRINLRCISLHKSEKPTSLLVCTYLVLFLETIIIICLAHLRCQPFPYAETQYSAAGLIV